MGTSDDDLTARKQRVQNRIDSDLSSGRITEAQANALRSALQSTAELEQRFRSDGIMKDREITTLYRQWDRIMGALDGYLSRNARQATGLRTR